MGLFPFPGYVIVGDTGDGQHAYNLCLEKRPDLVILDIMLLGLNGIEVLRRFSRHLKKQGFWYSVVTKTKICLKAACYQVLMDLWKNLQLWIS